MTKKTRLYNIHVKSGAKMTDFAGYIMPLQYTGVLDEHFTVREKVGLFDVSHMGEIWIKGDKALELIQYITTNDAARLKNGEAQYSCLPNGKGGIIDDIIVYKYSEDKYFFVVNASNVQKDWEWINKNNIYNAELENSTDNISQLAIQGPSALKTLQKLTRTDLSGVKYFSFIIDEIAGIKNVIVANTGYTGSGGFELYMYNDGVERIWNSILEAGAEYNIAPCGLAARDTLRLEKGYSLYGHEIDDTTSAIESGLGWIVKTNKSSDFIDKHFLTKQKVNGVSKKLVGFELIERGIPRHGYDIANNSGKIIGRVSSGTMSPSLKKPIGMGFVDIEFSQLNTIINIIIRNKNIKAKVVSLPFLQ